MAQAAAGGSRAAIGNTLHLVKRFFGAIKPGAPDEVDERWAIDQLLPGEVDIWTRMNNPDRRHAIGVARAVAAGYPSLDDGPIDRPVLAAALLHDSGKVISGLRTPARVLATVLWAVADDSLAARWRVAERRDFRVRLAEYRCHPELGQTLLAEAGAAPLTQLWAAQHHMPEERWTVPLPIGRLLKDCDDD
ncbi:MAG: hypothetical protein ACRBK7_15970 [Acidimicrobiales bacterium]